MAKLDVDLPINHAKAIGYVAAYSSLLENVIEETIWGLLGISEKNIGRAVTAELSLASKTNLLLTIAQERLGNEALIGELKAIHKKILDKDLAREDSESLNKRRNRVIHCRWRTGLMDTLLGFTTRTAENYRARGKVTPDFKSLSDEDILKIAQDFALMAGQLDDWSERAIKSLKNDQESSDAP